MMVDMTQNERLAVIETQMKQLIKEVTDLKNTQGEFLAFKNKGMGAFWFGSLLAGTGIVSLMSTVIGWFK